MTIVETSHFWLASARALSRHARKMIMSAGIVVAGMSVATLAPASTNVARPAFETGGAPVSGASVTARLDFGGATALDGRAPSMLRIAVRSRADEIGAERSLVYASRIEAGAVMGILLDQVPAGTKLSAGFEAGPGKWIVPAAALEDVRVTLPPDLAGPRQATVHLILATGEIRPYASLTLAAARPAPIGVQAALSTPRLARPTLTRVAAIDTWHVPAAAEAVTATTPAPLQPKRSPLVSSRTRTQPPAAPRTRPAEVVSRAKAEHNRCARLGCDRSSIYIRHPGSPAMASNTAVNIMRR